MKDKSLEDLIRSTGNPIDYLRNSQVGVFAFPVVPAEFTSWRNEQRGWRETVALADQSYHMANLLIKGPDAVRLLESARLRRERQNSLSYVTTMAFSSEMQSCSSRKSGSCCSWDVPPR
jgi:hypothetical protein